MRVSGKKLGKTASGWREMKELSQRLQLPARAKTNTSGSSGGLGARRVRRGRVDGQERGHLHRRLVVRGQQGLQRWHAQSLPHRRGKESFVGIDVKAKVAYFPDNVPCWYLHSHLDSASSHIFVALRRLAPDDYPGAVSRVSVTQRLPTGQASVGLQILPV